MGEAIDTIMLGRFAAQYEEGAAGFFVDADEAQEVALQVKAALSLGKRIMEEVHNDLSIPTDVACKVYAAIKRATNPQKDIPETCHERVKMLEEALEEARLIVANLPHDESLFLAKIDAALLK